MFDTFSRHIAFSIASFRFRVWASSSSEISSLCISSVNMALTHSSSRSPQSALEASSTRFAWNCSSFSVFICFLQMKLHLPNATILVVIQISSRVIKLLVVAVCRSRPGLFCWTYHCSSAPGLRTFASASTHREELHKKKLLFSTWFSQPTLFSWVLTSRFFFWASVSPVISTS